MFRKRKNLKIGLYGPVNSGKTTLANRICMDWLGEELGSVSVVPHETREVQIKEKVTMKIDGKSLGFNLVDTPGIATKIDFEDFMRHGMNEDESKQRAKEATRGVIESIKWLNDMDMVLVVMDSTRNPLSQVNITILGNLDARKTPFIIVSNKIDLKKSDTTKIRNSFPGYDVIGVSAKNGDMMKEFYKMMLDKL
jgi:small GTP-binding protein